MGTAKLVAELVEAGLEAEAEELVQLTTAALTHEQEMQLSSELDKAWASLRAGVRRVVLRVASKAQYNYIERNTDKEIDRMEMQLFNYIVETINAGFYSK